MATTAVSFPSFKGVVMAPVYSPFTADGSGLNLSVIPAFAADLVAQGMAKVFNIIQGTEQGKVFNIIQGTEQGDVFKIIQRREQDIYIFLTIQSTEYILRG